MQWTDTCCIFLDLPFEFGSIQNHTLKTQSKHKLRTMQRQVFESQVSLTTQTTLPIDSVFKISSCIVSISRLNYDVYLSMGTIRVAKFQLDVAQVSYACNRLPLLKGPCDYFPSKTSHWINENLKMLTITWHFFLGLSPCTIEHTRYLACIL